MGEDQGGGIKADGDVAVGAGVEVGVVGEVVEVPEAEEPLGGIIEVDGGEAHMGGHVDEGLGVGAEADPGVVGGREEGVLGVVGGGGKGGLVELELPVRDARGIEGGKVVHGCRVSDADLAGRGDRDRGEGTGHEGRGRGGVEAEGMGVGEGFARGQDTGNELDLGVGVGER